MGYDVTTNYILYNNTPQRRMDVHSCRLKQNPSARTFPKPNPNPSKDD